MRNRHIRTFEEYSHEDGLEVDTQSYPEYNQQHRQQARDMVASVFDKGMGQAVADLCKEIGIRPPRPKDDASLEEVRKRAEEYFIQNPERISKFAAPQMNVVPVKSGDGVVRTNNLGGVHHDKYAG